MQSSGKNVSGEPPGEKVAVVIPCFQAGDTIERVVLSVADLVDDVVVVDDGCPESSGKKAESLRRGNVHVIHNERNLGVGGAVVAGYRRALELNARYVVKMDGDGQMEAARVDDLLRPLRTGEADYAKGNRFRQPGSLRTMPKVRLFGNSVLSFLVKFASGYWDIMDPTNGFTAIGRGLLEKIDLEKVARGYFFETDMLISLNIAGAVVRDVDIPARYGSERSSLQVRRELLRFPPRLLRGLARRIFARYFLYDFNMASVYLLLGLPVFLASVIFGIYQWIVSVATGVPRSAGTIMLVALPIIVSFQMILQAINIDIMSVPKDAGPSESGRRRGVR